MAEDDCPGLNRKHGFLKVVERNQISRDNYDKTEKEKREERRRKADRLTFDRETGRGRGRGESKRSLEIYVPPGRRGRDSYQAKTSGAEGTPFRSVTAADQMTPTDGSSEREGCTKEKGSRKGKTRTPLFKMEVELEDGQWRAFIVHKEDSAGKIAAKFGSKHNLSADIQRALEYKVRQEMKSKLTIS